METVTGLVALAVLVWGISRYQTFLKRSLQPRVFVTTLPPERLRELFSKHICTTGWKLISAPDAEPLVAQAPRWAGLRGALMPQEVSLEMQTADDGRLVAAVAATRFTTNLFGVPVRAHTLRHRLDRYVQGVLAADDNAAVRVSKGVQA